MLDAFIIDRIRREREQERQQENGAFIPLRIGVPEPTRPAPEGKRDEEDRSRGSVVIDFHV